MIVLGLILLVIGGLVAWLVAHPVVAKAGAAVAVVGAILALVGVVLAVTGNGADLHALSSSYS